MAEYIKYAKELQDALSPFRRMAKKPDFLSDLHYGEMAIFTAVMRLSDTSKMVKMTEISNLLEISRPALSQVVNRLEDKGLVERVFSKEDRRATYLTLTEKGQKLYQRNHEHMVLMGNTIVEKMGEDNAASLIDLLNIFLQALDEAKEEIPCKKEHPICQN